MRGRLAPSPTGSLHLGNARTALLAWLAARASSGALILRIEDLDRSRVASDGEAAILEAFRSLGIDWDEGPDCGGGAGPYRQSERAQRYRDALATLDRAGFVYPCACSRADVARAATAPHIGDEGPRYPGTCRDLPRDEVQRRALDNGRACCWRFRANATPVAFEDAVRGHCDSVVVDDFVLARADGVAAYQLAVVVDDAAMGITQVVRGDDLLTSTPRQIALYTALGWPSPEFAHVPLVLSPDGERLAKRNRPDSVRSLLESGVDARRIVGRLAASAGLCGEDARLHPRDLLPDFSFARLAKGAVTLKAADFASG